MLTTCEFLHCDIHMTEKKKFFSCWVTHHTVQCELMLITGAASLLSVESRLVVSPLSTCTLSTLVNTGTMTESTSFFLLSLRSMKSLLTGTEAHA